jgi:hypothetical protein
MGLYCDFEEDVDVLVLACEVNFSELADERGELKSVSKLAKLVGKKL